MLLKRFVLAIAIVVPGAIVVAVSMRSRDCPGVPKVATVTPALPPSAPAETSSSTAPKSLGNIEPILLLPEPELAPMPVVDAAVNQAVAASRQTPGPRPDGERFRPMPYAPEDRDRDSTP